jgi:hypothetical protein
LAVAGQALADDEGKPIEEAAGQNQERRDDPEAAWRRDIRPFSTAETTRSRRSTEYGRPIHAGLLPQPAC